MEIKKSALILLAFHNLLVLVFSATNPFEFNKFNGDPEDIMTDTQPASVNLSAHLNSFSPEGLSPGNIDSDHCLGSGLEFSSGFFRSKSGAQTKSITSAFNGFRLGSGPKTPKSIESKLSSLIASNPDLQEAVFQSPEQISDIEEFLKIHTFYGDIGIFSNFTSIYSFYLLAKRNMQLPRVSENSQVILMKAIIVALIRNESDVYRILCNHLLSHSSLSALTKFEEIFIKTLFDRNIDINYFSSFIEDTIKLWIGIKGASDTMSSFMKAYFENNFPLQFCEVMMEAFNGIFITFSVKIPSFEVKVGQTYYSFFAIFYNYLCKKHIDVAFRISRNVLNYVEKLKNSDVLYMLLSAEFIQNEDLFAEIINYFYVRTSDYFCFGIEFILESSPEYLAPLATGLKAHLPSISALKISSKLIPKVKSIPILLDILTSPHFTKEHLMAHLLKSELLIFLSRIIGPPENIELIDISVLNYLLADFDLFSRVDGVLELPSAYSLLKRLLHFKYDDNQDFIYRDVINYINSADIKCIKTGKVSSIAKLVPNLAELLRQSLLHEKFYVAEIICAFFRIEDGSFSDLKPAVALNRGAAFTDVAGKGVMIDLFDEHNTWYGIPFEIP